MNALSSHDREIATNELADARISLRDAMESLEHVADVLSLETDEENDG